MDHSSFLYNIKELPKSDLRSKSDTLSYAFKKVTELHPDLTLENFIISIPTVILNTKFGSTAEDIYCTSTLSTLSFFQTDADVIYAAVLNRIVLELNFQTRFLGSGGHSEALLLDGAPALFPFAMANGNVIAGINIDPDSSAFPDWAGRLSHIDYQRHNLFSAPLEDVPQILKTTSRTRIGCLAIRLPLGSGKINLSERYNALSDQLAEDTYHVVSAPLWMGLNVIKSVETACPAARIVSKVYQAEGNAEPRIILIVTGIKGAMPVEINQIREIDVAIESISNPAINADGDFSIVKYYKGKNGADAESIRLKAPLAIRSSAPLPFECRDRISDHFKAHQNNFPHRAYRIEQGKLASIGGFQFECHVYMNREYDVLKELCDPSGIEFSELYRDSLVDTNGRRTAKLSVDQKIKIDGPVMPLTFTPTLHTYHSHFLLQCFPRVLVFRELIPDGKIIVPATLRKKQIEMLHLAGIEEDQLVFLPTNSMVEADELVVPHAWPLVFSPYTLQIYDELVRKLPKVAPLCKRALISRAQRTTWRNMLTYDLVKNALVEKYGFTVVRPESLSLAEEVSLYSNVEIMAGAEGAGLYSSVFAKPGSTYISIGDEDYIMPVLASAAEVRGFDVAYAFGESMRSDFDVNRRKPFGHSDFVIDPKTVTDLIDEVLASQK